MTAPRVQGHGRAYLTSTTAAATRASRWQASEPAPPTPADFLAAAQALVRPGVARTQAVLARELSGGSDAAVADNHDSESEPAQPLQGGGTKKGGGEGGGRRDNRTGGADG